jgi:hypothetical protein
VRKLPRRRGQRLVLLGYVFFLMIKLHHETREFLGQRGYLKTTCGRRTRQR